MIVKRTLIVMLLLVVCRSAARGAMSASGDVRPADPNTWTDANWIYLGESGSGSVSVDGGSDLVSGTVVMGFYSTADGTMTVSGAGSTWTNTNAIVVGDRGRGTLSVSGGA